MAKNKKNQSPSQQPEIDPTAPAPDLSQEGQAGAPPEAATPIEEIAVPVNPDGEVAGPNLPEILEDGVDGEPTHVNSVDVPFEPGNSFAEFFLDLLDAGGEEPTCPADELLAPADEPLVLPDDQASNEALIDGARRLMQIVGWRMRRSVQEWWLIGCHLTILKSRPENDGRWRTEILPQVGINHTTDHQLRTMAEKIPFERCLDYKSKTEALKSIGFFAPLPKQLGGPQVDAGNGSKDQDVAEEIFGLERFLVGRDC